MGNRADDIIPVDGEWRAEIDRLIEREWAGPMVATNGVLHNTSQAEGFVFFPQASWPDICSIAWKRENARFWFYTAWRKTAELGRRCCVRRSKKPNRAAAAGFGWLRRTTTSAPSGFTNGLAWS